MDCSCTLAVTQQHTQPEQKCIGPPKASSWLVAPAGCSLQVAALKLDELELASLRGDLQVSS